MKLLDHHTHSSFSIDSKEDLRNYFIEASKSLVDYVCTCEHIDFQTDPTRKDWIVDFEGLIDYQQKLKEEFPTITPLLGLELGYNKKRIQDMHKIALEYPFDIIQLSIHDNGVDDYYFTSAFSKGIEYELNNYFEITLDALDNFSNFDSLSHIDFAFKTAKNIDNSSDITTYEAHLIKIFTKLIKLNKALEINCKTNNIINKINRNNSHTKYLLSLYKSLGGEKITLSSDAHSITTYRDSFDFFIDLIKEEGFDYITYFIKRKPFKYKLKGVN